MLQLRHLRILIDGRLEDEPTFQPHQSESARLTAAISLQMKGKFGLDSRNSDMASYELLGQPVEIILRVVELRRLCFSEEGFAAAGMIPFLSRAESL
jgi:hypothetical protein